MGAQPAPAREPAAVVVIGSYLVALVMEVERFPAVGETVNGGGYFETHGGKGSNMAVQAARLGARCSFAGRVGDDARGQAFRAMLTGEGVDTSHLHLQEGIATGVGFVILGPGGQNMITIDSGANGRFSTADVDRAAAAMRPPATVLTQLEIPLATALRGMRCGREAGCTTILNPAPAQDLSAHDLASVSVITPNETEARVCLGMAASERADEETLGRRLLERGCGAALLTLGERGCLCVTAAGSEHVPGYAVPEVVDTTGAGDAFNATLAVALSEGRPLVEAARFANAAAALCCTRLATLPAYHTREQVDAFLESVPALRDTDDDQDRYRSIASRPALSDKEQRT